MYNKNYYLKNKDKFLEWQRIYRLKNKELVKSKRKEYDKKNKSHQLELKKQWRKLNPKSYKEYNRRDYVKKKARESMRKKSPLLKEYRKDYYQKNKEKIKAYQKQHSQKPEVKARKAELARIRRRLNPQSNRSDSLELQFAKNRVRLRDGNKCRWQGCVITHKEDKIHVHHIFPKSEYPELELEERYMICYCAVHHRQFHRVRGDHYSEMITSTFGESERITGENKRNV